ncbi:hypothetical protein EVAR_75135_1 [Eumeta japonica]|uniref:Uncharacterized protein n=1 Tax=Eumeta variegata TaxID=151549 RepID=A0A4C1U0J8_EUMVA|nr:hypothetical protein EVAR_75135_1 [Eumeta japonica]
MISGETVHPSRTAAQCVRAAFAILRNAASRQAFHYLKADTRALLVVVASVSAAALLWTVAVPASIPVATGRSRDPSRCPGVGFLWDVEDWRPSLLRFIGGLAAIGYGSNHGDEGVLNTIKIPGSKRLVTISDDTTWQHTYERTLKSDEKILSWKMYIDRADIL